MKPWAARWAPVLVWMGVIFFVSDQTSLPPVAPDVPREVVNTAGHLLEYGVLGLLLLRAGVPQGAAPAVGILVALWAVALSYGVLDELHQARVPGRAASAYDVLVDATAALLGMALYRRWQGRRGNKKEGIRATPPG